MTSALLQAEAAAALGVGVAIASLSTPSLNAVYPIDEDAQRKYAATFSYVIAFGAFPAGQPQWSVRDANGLVRTFASLSQFQAFCRAVADYVARLYMIIDEIDQTSTTLPAPPAPIP